MADDATKTAKARTHAGAEAAATAAADEAAVPVAEADAPEREEVLCPVCGHALVVYVGDNPHKVGTGFCIVCGTRYPLERPQGSEREP